MKINGSTRVCGVIGNPIEHTMSPAIHNTIAASQGENLVYVPFHVPTGHVEEAVKGALALNILGLNVTVPYKSEVIPHLNAIDELAKNIGAVNTLVRNGEGYKGYNTDMPGLYRAMTEDGIEIAGQKVILLGAGGVSRAVAMLLATKGVKEVLILNRTIEKAKQIAAEVNGIAGKELVKTGSLASWRDLVTENPCEKWLCIQATNVGMYPKEDEVLIEDPEFYRLVHTGYDLIYRPAKTKFMQMTEMAGGKAFNGLKMLLWQGIIAYELWTGSSVDDKQAKEAFAAMKVAMNITEEAANES